MPASLFGKLPDKRDFVASLAPRGFLEVWEPWLQASMATSRQMLGSDWNDAYNRAPIWRYWLGAQLCGEAMIGAFMASVDGVGRSFPLTIFIGESGASLPPPEIDANDAWYEAAEALLLDALDPATKFEAVARGVAAMAPPALQAREGGTADVEEMADGAVLVRNPGDRPEQAFGEARRFGHRRFYASQSCWWTIGGEDYPPMALAVVGMPSPASFVHMLTGLGVQNPGRSEEIPHGS
jgi:type VI secretion system protein ImpM